MIESSAISKSPYRRGRPGELERECDDVAAGAYIMVHCTHTPKVLLDQEMTMMRTSEVCAIIR